MLYLCMGVVCSSDDWRQRCWLVEPHKGGQGLRGDRSLNGQHKSAGSPSGMHEWPLDTQLITDTKAFDGCDHLRQKVVAGNLAISCTL